MSFAKQGSSPILAADTALNTYGATITFLANGLELKVPGLNLDQNLVQVPATDLGTSDSAPDPRTETNAGVSSLVGYGSNYDLGGVWIYDNALGIEYSAFVTGYETPESAIPTTGTASYNSAGGVLGTIFVPSGSNLDTAALEGDVSLVANFSARTINGGFTNMVAVDENGDQTAWNDVTVTAGYEIVTKKVAGGTAAASAPGTRFALKANATGYLEGDFYGPNYNEIGAVWSLSNNDSTGSALGFLNAENTNTFLSMTDWDLDLLGYATWPANGWFAATNPVIGAPAAPTSGNSPTAGPTATAGGPTFDGSSGTYPAINTSFPLTFTAMNYPSSGLAADAVTNSGGATIEILNATSSATQYDIRIPGLGIDTPLNLNALLTAGRNDGVDGPNYDIGVTTFGLSYTAFGDWDADDPGVARTSKSYFVTGYQTPDSSMPVSGTATYSGPGMVAGTVYVTSNSGGAIAEVGGDANLSADFAAGKVTGNFSNMASTTGRGTPILPWNDVSVTANIASGKSTFSGATAATSAPSNNAYGLKTSATGFVTGGFYGPSANQLGAVWTLSNNDGTGSALGVVGAVKQ